MDKIERKPHTFLTLQSKLEIAQRSENGENIQTLSKAYGVSHKTICRIIKQKELLKDRKSLQKGGVHKKRFTGVAETQLDKTLFNWFIQQRDVGIPVSGSMLQNQALYLNKLLGGPSDFKASNGWLYRYQQRHCLRDEPGFIESVPSAIEEFVKVFYNLVEKNGITMDNVYCCDETGLLWKYISNKRSGTCNEKFEDGNKMARDKVTIMTCTNTTGTHKVPLLVIGKSKQSRFENDVCLPAIYAYQENANMNTAIFVEWFQNIFVSSVKAKNKQVNENVILIMDTACFHPSVEELSAIYPECTVLYIPTKIKALTQPMNQGVFEALKILYRKNAFATLLGNPESQSKSPDELLDSWTLLHCVKALQASWESLNKQIICKAWRSILKRDSGLEHIIGEFINLDNQQLEESFSEEVDGNWMAIDGDDTPCPEDDMEHTETTEQEVIDTNKSEGNKKESAIECLNLLTPEPQMSVRDVCESLTSIYNWAMQRQDIDQEQIQALCKFKDTVSNIALNEQYEEQKT